MTIWNEFSKDIKELISKDFDKVWRDMHMIEAIPVPATQGWNNYMAEKKLETALTGWSSKYYELPPGAKEIQDLIEYRKMDFSTGCVFKAAYRMGFKNGTTELYDWEKIAWFAARKIKELSGD